MATASLPVSYWIGEPRRVEDELCPECFLPSLIWVPYYTFFGDDMMRENSGLECFKRTVCHAGCGWGKVESI